MGNWAHREGEDIETVTVKVKSGRQGPEWRGPLCG